MRRPQLLVVGDVRLVDGRTGRRIEFPTRKAEALFVHVALVRAHVTRDECCRLLWPEVPRTQGRHSLRQACSQIRTALGELESLLRVDGDRINIDLRGLRVDAHLLERLLARGTAAALRHACAISRGAPLADLAVPEQPFDTWLAGERARIHDLAVAAHERYLEHILPGSNASVALQTASRLVALSPTNESGTHALMQLHCASGNRRAALRQYEMYAALVSQIHDVEPSPHLTQLYRRLRTEA